MKSQALFQFRKKLNAQIAKKTNISQTAKKQQMQQSRIQFHKIPKLFQKDLLNTLDYDFSHLTPHKKIQLDQTYNISLFTYSQQFYCLQMVNYVFPMRVLFKNVRHDGMLYIGYDQPYPGIYSENTLSIFQSNAGENKKNYDFKSIIDRDMLVTLKNKGSKIVQYVYFTFVAGSSLLIFDFKVQFLGFAMNERVLSQGKFKSQQKSNSVIKQRTIGNMVRQKTEPAQKFERSKLPQLRNQKMVSLQQFQVFTGQAGKRSSQATQFLRQGSKQFLKQGSNQLTQYNNTNSLTHRKKSESQPVFKLTLAKGPSNLNVPRSDLELKMQQVKRNKQMHDIYVVKDRELRETASKCKRLIQDYRKIYNQQSVRRRKINKDVSTTIYSMLYVSIIQKKYQEKIRKKKMQIKVAYLCIKFVKKLKRKYEESCKMVPYRYRRAMTQGITTITLQSKILFKHSKLKASKIANETLRFLTPFINLQRSISLSIVYRNKIILIQNYWKVKYQNRITCILYFIQNHIQKTCIQYPQFAMFINQFYKAGMHKELCLKYIKDQSQKYRYIYASYRKKLNQINDILELNKSMAMSNPSMKSKLNLPKKQPIKPMHRFYRNLDILRSMVRTWFQIQHKKHIKKNSNKSLKSLK